jgi:hypothetical protein
MARTLKAFLSFSTESHHEMPELIQLFQKELCRDAKKTKQIEKPAFRGFALGDANGYKLAGFVALVLVFIALWGCGGDTWHSESIVPAVPCW